MALSPPPSLVQLVKDNLNADATWKTWLNSLYQTVKYPRWDDLRFPSQGINPPGSASDPGIEANTGLFLFDAASTEIVAGIAQMPHSWLVESTIKPHVHWQKTTSASGNVLWQIDYEVWNNGDTANMTYSNTLFSSAVVAGTPDNNTANEILITALGDIDMTGIGI